ncbi:hypothetical protein LTR95_012824 [Oleoguttula sp. CCFEE 5521]
MGGSMNASTDDVQAAIDTNPEQARPRDMEDIPAAVLDYIKSHPKQTRFMVVNGDAIFAPGLIFGPSVTLSELGLAGVAADSAAADMQADTGAVKAGNLFAHVQSAAMGGYGVGLWGGVVKAVCLVAAWLCSLLRGGGPTDGEKTGGEKDDTGADESEENAERALWDELETVPTIVVEYIKKDPKQTLFIIKDNVVSFTPYFGLW